ncbi:MAG: hypothetical protein D4R95_02380 [Actinobacteria bacterium]|nr:MAG: hypothetical protein D4R95_02380 [Actinomycetota bacterium]
MGPLSKEIPQIDLRSIWQVVRLRWWIVPICLFVSAGLMFAQESDLQDSPASINVNKIYGAKDETAGLASFGVDLDAIKEFPSFQNQLAIVRAEGPQLLLANSQDLPAVSLSRAEPQVSMLAAADGDGKQVFTVSSNGAANYGFSCSAPNRQQCDQAIDVYVQKVENERRVAITTGLLQLETQIRSVLAIATSDSFALQLQADAIKQSSGSITGELAYVSETVETTGGTVSTVKWSTYLFGLAVGLVVAILIMLQLTASDDKIRSARKLKDAILKLAYLGEIDSDYSPASSSQVAAAIIIQARAVQSTKVTLLPIGMSTIIDKTLKSLESTTLTTHLDLSMRPDARSMSVEDLVGNTSSYILVAHKNLSTCHDAQNAIEILQRSGNQILGALLVAE